MPGCALSPAAPWTTSRAQRWARAVSTGVLSDGCRTSASLREYVLVDHYRVAVEVRTRGDDGAWSARHYGSGEIVELHSLAATVAADDFYEDVTLER